MSNTPENIPDPTFHRNFLNNVVRLIKEALDAVEAQEAEHSKYDNTHGTDDASYFER
jgi:hypothetical protein